jgi:N-acetylglucosamine-6-phosphate deacetylase
MFVIRSDGPPVYVRNGKIVRPGRGFAPVRVRGRVIPGLIDIHVNGCYGIDFGSASIEELLEAARRLARIGVTSFMPTIISRPQAETLAALDRVNAARDLQREGARILGAHLEGPMITRAGAHPKRHLREHTRAEWTRARMITLAPEFPGAMGVIRAASRGRLVAIGHSDADAATALRAVDAGARLVGHLFNAMRGFHHRDESIVNVALTDARLACELIYDGEHVSRSAARVAAACQGDRLIRVSDATAGPHRTARGRLAGSATLLPEALERAVRDFGDRAIEWATRNPARLLGLRAGLAADLIAVDERFNATAVWVGGLRVTGEPS